MPIIAERGFPVKAFESDKETSDKETPLPDISGNGVLFIAIMEIPRGVTMMEREYWEIIADRIRTLRAKRGFSTYKLETMSGVDTSTIESIEKGQSKNPTIQTLHKIAIGFNMTIAEFLDFPELNEYSFDDTSKDEDD